MHTTAALLLALACGADPAPQAAKYFKITVVDDQTGRGVPLVELRTVNGIRLWTDSHGVAAFREPGLMDQTVFFHVASHGYEFPKDGFGIRGTALKTAPGGSASLKIKRVNIAERLYRITGGGVYADSLLVGEKVPTERPALNGQVLGSDSNVSAIYKGRVYWFWGDTNRPAYPLGNFQVPGATSRLPGDGGLAPEVGVNLDYFLDNKGFAKETARMPGDGPTWLTSLVVLRDGKGERMFGGYLKVKPPLEAYARGLAEWDDEKQAFRKVAAIDLKAPLVPDGHAFLHTTEGVEYVYFANPYPLTRVKADPASLARPADYEGFTCLKEGTTADDGKIDRDGGRVRWSWKKGTAAPTARQEAKLIASGALREDEALARLLRDSDTGKAVVAHRGSVCWNHHRKRWVMIAVQSGGTSMLGEVWYAEADAPVGPWVYARKVVTHQRYSFYNPVQHPFFDQKGGRFIFFEGTYATTFSGNDDATPRYDYNQIMYRLDLDDPRLVLPAPVYATGEGNYGFARARKAKGEGPAFFALDRPRPGSVAVYAGDGLRLDAPAPGAKAAFHALPADLRDPPAAAVPLYEFIHADGKRRAYSTDKAWHGEGFTRADKPLCLVWGSPTRLAWAE